MSNLGKSYCTSQMTNKDLPKPTYFEDNHNFLKLFSTQLGHLVSATD
jgi:hypothetical protein